MNKDYYQIIKICRMYYLHDLTQSRIAENLRISKSSVSRLLKEGKEGGIITFHIKEPRDRWSLLEEELERIFGLKEAVVVSDEGDEGDEGDKGIDYSGVLKKKVAKAAAMLLRRRVREGDTVAVSWGTTLAEVVKALNPPFSLNTEVVPLLGGIDSRGAEIHSNEIVRRMAEIFGGRYHVLHSPLIVNNLAAKRALEEEKNIKMVLQKAKSADIALVGIGIANENSTMVQRGYFSAQELNEVATKGAVGDICTNFYDIYGNICELSLDKKRIGLGLEEVRQIPNVIGVASGKSKAEAILGALRGKHVNMVVTNKSVAQYLIDEQGDFS